MKGSAAGGTGNYKYYFYYQKSGETAWTEFGAAYRTETTATLKASSAVEYIIRVYVQDDSGTFDFKEFSIKYYQPLTIKSLNVPAEAAVGDLVEISAVVTGGTGEYTYQYYYKEDPEIDEWTPFDEENTTETTAKLTSNDLGVYPVMLIVTDGSHKIAYKETSVSFVDKEIVH